jgi:hypothetical protein
MSAQYPLSYLDCYSIGPTSRPFRSEVRDQPSTPIAKGALWRKLYKLAACSPSFTSLLSCPKKTPPPRSDVTAAVWDLLHDRKDFPELSASRCRGVG